MSFCLIDLYVIKTYLYLSWYRELCLKQNEKNWKPGPSLITTRVRSTPCLLRLQWNNNPLLFDKGAWYYVHLTRIFI